jgi:dolichyl-phosphate-mannose-protein mannosyltransferase
MRNLINKIKTMLFTKKQLIQIPTVFISAILILHGLMRYLRNQVYFDMDNFWPISIVLPRYPVWQDILTLLAVLIIWFLYLRFWKQKKPLKYFLILSFFLILSTNLLQGLKEGWAHPINCGSSKGNCYWNDVNNMSDIPRLLKNYTLIQPYLEIHSSNHPPGAMIVIFILRQIFYDNPYLVSITIAALAISSAYFLYDLLRKELSEKTAKLAGALLLLLPSVQIYFLATLDALVLTLFIATIWAWQKAKKTKWFWLSLLFLWLASFITCGVIFLLPLILFDEWRREGKIGRSIKLFLSLAGAYYLLYLFTGFDYWQSYQISVHKETLGGFYGVYDTLSYVITRFENVIEILVFLGPFLTFLLWQALKKFRFKTRQKFNLVKYLSGQGKIESLGWMAVLALLGFFATGAYYTGETARNAQYIYPFLLIIIASYLNKKKLKISDELLLLNLVFSQALIMQMFGWYAW